MLFGALNVRNFVHPTECQIIVSVIIAGEIVSPVFDKQLIGVDKRELPALMVKLFSVPIKL